METLLGARNPTDGADGTWYIEKLLGWVQPPSLPYGPTPQTGRGERGIHVFARVTTIECLLNTEIGPGLSKINHRRIKDRLCCNHQLPIKKRRINAMRLGSQVYKYRYNVYVCYFDVKMGPGYLRKLMRWCDVMISFYWFPSSLQFPMVILPFFLFPIAFYLPTST